MSKRSKIIGERKELLGYGIQVNHGIIFVDHKGNWWLGGSGNKLGFAVFPNRKQAQKMARKIRRQRPDLIKWTLTRPVFLTNKEKP